MPRDASTCPTGRSEEIGQQEALGTGSLLSLCPHPTFPDEGQHFSGHRWLLSTPAPAQNNSYNLSTS